MDLPLTRAFVKQMPNYAKTDKAKEAVKMGVEIGLDHYALMSVAANAGLLTHAIMKKAIVAWAAYLKSNAATYKLAEFLEARAFELTVASDSTASDVGFAKSMATMLLIEKRLIDNSGYLTNETMHALEVTWRLEILRLTGTDAEFEAINKEWQTAWAVVESAADE